MEKDHKIFKPFDKVLVREMNPIWSCDLYSHYNSNSRTHETITLRNIEDDDILPYEGYEHLAGTSQEPEEIIEFKEGEFLLCSVDINQIKLGFGTIGTFHGYNYDQVVIKTDTIINHCGFEYFIRFSEFNPSDMEETRKHILCLRYGRVAPYKE